VVNGVLLPHVIRFNARSSPGRFVPVARAMGLDVAGLPDEVAAEQAAEAVGRLAADLGCPRGLAELGVREADIDTLACTTLGDACLSTNPRDAGQADIAALFRAAL
jgi:alcohol dehydrogenase class IV